MAERIEKFATSAAAGASDLVVPHTFIAGQVTRVELYVPDGHGDLTEWRFFYGSGQLIPFTTGQKIIANDRQFAWDLDNAPTGTGYNSVVSNADVIAHRFHVEVWLIPLEEAASEPQLPVLVLPYG